MYYVERYRQICKIHLKVLGVKKGKNLSGWSDIYGLMMIGVQLTTTKNHFPCHLLLKSYYPREFNRRQDLSTDYTYTHRGTHTDTHTDTQTLGHTDKQTDGQSHY